MKKQYVYGILGVLLIVMSVSGCTTSEETEVPINETVKPIVIEPEVMETSIVIEIPEIIDDITYKSVIPDDYYDIEVDQYFIDHKLYNYLKKYTWGRPVCKGMWSLYEITELEQELTNMGCNVTIRWASVKTTIDHTDFENRVLTDQYERLGCQPELDQISCWLMIELDDKWVAYDPIHCFWIFEPEYTNKNEYVKGGKWYDYWYYEENITSMWKGNSWTAYDFIDFKDIYELEAYYLSGEMQSNDTKKDKRGIWWNYANSDKYNATDDFLITFGWWISDKEFHKIETRINEATTWFQTLPDIEVKNI